MSTYKVMRIVVVVNWTFVQIKLPVEFYFLHFDGLPEQLYKFSIVQTLLHPSLSNRFPSSHCSPGSTIPFPQLLCDKSHDPSMGTNDVFRQARQTVAL
jgi:hypothetical protein